MSIYGWNRTERAPHRPPVLVLAAIALILFAGVAPAANCPVPQLPRVDGDPAVIRAELEANGLWQRNGGPTLSPPADPQVGDSWLWYVWDLGGFPVANLKSATVRGMGDHCYIVVDDEEWQVSMFQDDVDRIVEHFEYTSVGEFSDQGIWDLDTGHFGEPPNPLDGLDRIFLFYYHFGISADGFFWSFDQFPDGSQSFASNECDVVYMATDSGEPASNYMLAVAAHEFQHLIHFARDTNEESWVEEGLGELAMWLFGNPDNISSFPNNPDNSLVNWGGAWADYIQTYLWTLYSYEQYGGQPLIWNLAHDPANGMAGYRNALSGLGYTITPQNLFDDWSVANYLDDTTVPDGQYGYAGDDLPPFTAWRTHDTYPASGAAGVQAYATDYVRLTDLAAVPTITFDGAVSGDWRLSLMALDSDLPTLVIEMPLDADDAGVMTVSAAADYDQVVMSVANTSQTNSSVYTYNVELGTTAAPVTAVATVLSSYPNPFNPRTALRIDLPAAGHAKLTIHAADGRLVRTLVDGELAAGVHEPQWLGTDNAGRSVPAGVYLARLVTTAATVVDKLTLVR